MMGIGKLITFAAVLAMSAAVSAQSTGGNLVPNGAPDGTSGQSLNFTGIGFANTEIPTTNVLNYSMSLWISPDLIPGENFFIGQTNQGIHHGLRNEGKLHQAHWGNDHSGNTTVPTGPASDPNSWVHAAYTYDFDNSLANIYYNGAVDNDPAGVSKGEPNQFGPDNFLIFGARNGGDAGFAGQIDDVAFWDHVISTDDIAAIAAGTLPTAVSDPAQLFFDFEDALNADGSATLTSKATGDGIWDVAADHSFNIPVFVPPPAPIPEELRENAALPLAAGNWNARWIKLDEGGADGQINNAVEARDILAFADGGPNTNNWTIQEDEADTRDRIDMAGNGGAWPFPHNHPYPDAAATNNADLNDFLVHASTIEPLQFPEGTYAVAFGSDDGGDLRLTDTDGNPVNFTLEDNTNMDVMDGDNIITWDTPRGNAVTCGVFDVPAGGLGIHVDAIFHERGGGDSFEIGLAPSGRCDLPQNTSYWRTLSEESVADLSGGGGTFLDGDINMDMTVNSADLGLLLNNFNKSGDLDGDLNGDMNVDSADLGLLLNNFNKSSGAAAVPEPNAGILLGLGMLGLLARRRRR